jgi:transcriptional regulator with XRE-family HTH domain
MSTAILTDAELEEYCRRLIARRIRQARLQAGLSQARLGELIGADGQRVCRWERQAQRRGISPSKLMRIAAATGKPLHWFYIDELAG